MRRAVWLAAVCIAGALGAPDAAAAQGVDLASGVLNGTVYDSLSGQFLSGAQVILGDRVASARTDAQGRFTLQAPAGRYEVTFAKSGLSSWRVLRHPMNLRIEEGRTVSATLATASQGTVLDRTCGASGTVVGGVVMDLLTLVPLAATLVELGTKKGAGPKAKTLNTAGDGSWFDCLMDDRAEVEIRAHIGASTSRPVLMRGPGAVRVHDVYVKASEPASLQGLVLDGESNAPLVDASVQVMGTRLRTLTGSDGRFAFRGVPPGGIQLAVERIGYGRKVASMRADGGTTARVTLELFPEAIALDSVVVTVEGGIAERNRMPTRFDGLDRAAIEKLLPRAMAFDDLLRNANIPGLRVREITYMRASGFREPGLCVELSRRSATAGRQCQMLEVYLNDVRLADPEITLSSLDPTTIDRFQLLSSANAGIQYLGTPRSRNGILLIWTRARR